VPLRKLRQFQDLGHTVVLIIATSRRSSAIHRAATPHGLRCPWNRSNAHAQTYVDQAFKILDADKTELRRNSDWLAPLGFAELLRLTSQFTVRAFWSAMISRALCGAEVDLLTRVLYPVAQAYDSVMIEPTSSLAVRPALQSAGGRELMEKQGMNPKSR